MAPPSFKKRKVEDGMNGRTSRPKKKFKKQRAYHSSSEDEENDSDPNDEVFSAVNLQDSDSEQEDKLSEDAQEQKLPADSDDEEGITTATATKSRLADDDENEDETSGSDSHAPSSAASASGSGSDIDSDDSMSGTDQSRSTRRKKLSKRNDPTAFSTSISKILSTKLPTAARADPLLSRSRSTAETTSELANEKLESRARAKLRAEKREELERGRIRDVLGVERGEAGETAEQEKRLRKIAQRGVVKLFNAVRAAQVRGEELAREERRKRGIVGMAEREKAVNEVSKQGFLDLINGKGGKSLGIEEA
ncbi:hypothetical protein AJ78_07267 [Emergomyces pasteurianus Ep9510]|uniref:Ribosomal RNA-processing protein 15 n=1 Tax=Emergomyces pasteurianus Ep9510 TaxID=1447872 RepID=A0A1J9P849_9EURO|nr:hypothetical protein AJ78_07267 [Emergomyces pasteurianus Ep9510]